MTPKHVFAFYLLVCFSALCFTVIVADARLISANAEIKRLKDTIAWWECQPRYEQPSAPKECNAE